MRLGPVLRTSGQKGSKGRHGSPLHTTTSKLQLKYRTTITVINRVEWKFDNYGIKETESIETGRRGADAEWAGLSSMHNG